MRTKISASFFLSFIFLIAVGALLVGCGGNASPAASNTPTMPTPPATTPTTPTTPPSGGSGSGGSGSGGGSTPTPPTFTPPANSQFQQSIIVNGAAGHGSVYVSTSGDVTIQMTGAQASSTFTWRFCTEGWSPIGCFDMNQTLMTDASGSGQLTFHFPRSGGWVGYFEGSSGSSTVSTQLATIGTLSAVFMPGQQTNGATCATCVQGPITGSVTVSNGNAHIVLHGAPANDNHEVDLIGSTSTKLGNVITDGSGNLTADVPTQGSNGSLLEIWDHMEPAPIVSGFKVP